MMQRLQHLLLGGAYLGSIAVPMSYATGLPYWQALLALVGSLFALFAVLLVLGVRWASAPSGAAWQLRLGSLLIAMVGVGVYFAMMRVVLAGMERRGVQLTASHLLSTFIASAVFLAVSAPFVILFGEALLAIAVWIVWQPRVQRWLRRRKPAQ